MAVARKNTRSRRKGGRPRKRKVKNFNRQNGRKRINIEKASLKTKQRRAEEIAVSVNYDVSLLELALKIAIKKQLVNKQVEQSEKSEKIFQFERHDNDSALAFFLEYGFTKYGYKGLVSDSRSRGCSMYPCYDNLEKSKQECRFENLLLHTDNEICVPLQSVLDKTAERLCSTVANDWNESSLRDITLSVSLGFDSSSGHLDPHQKSEVLQTPNTDIISSAQQSLFVTSMNIIQLESCCDKISEEKNIWINPTPQSIRFTRPLRLSSEKETDRAIKKEHDRLKVEIKNLKVYRFKMENNTSVRVKYIVTETLFDGKCVNTLVGNKATSRCPMCLRTSHQFGDLKDDFEPIDSSLFFGLSLLHAEIKAFEHLLHLSYRLELKVWDIRKDLIEKFNQRKLKIQQNVYEKFGVKVDLILQGHGTTNTGNIARRCFSNPILFAECLEISSTLVHKLSTIISAFKSKQNLKLDILETFCIETYNLHYQLYPWSRMNPSTHKLLRHGCQVARKFPLPLAFYSEDASESWHKLYRKNMREHARQISRKARLLDVFNRAVYLSDPKISLLLIKKRMRFHKTQRESTDVSQFYQMSQMIIDEDSEDDVEITDTNTDDELIRRFLENFKTQSSK